MAINELCQLIYLPMDTVLVAPPPEDTPDEETPACNKPDLTLPPCSNQDEA